MCFYFLIREKITKFAVKLSFYAHKVINRLTMSESTPSPSAMEQFDAFLRSKQKRRTSERFAIFQCAQSLGGHFSAELLRQALADSGFHVSTATVYSTLELLVEAGLILCHNFDGRCRLYEYAGASHTSHHHLICTVCGRIKEMRDSEVDTIINIYGECRSCQNRRRRASKN